MYQLKRFFRFLEKQAGKFLVVGVVAFIALMIITDGSTSDPIMVLAILASMIVAALGVIGFVLRFLNKLGKDVKNLGKKVSKSFSKAFGNTSAKKSKDDNIVTLRSAKGEDIDFVEIAGIAYRGNFYAILQPVKLLDGMKDDEALVFKVTRGRNGEDNFEIELNDSIVDAVFKEYDKLYAQAHKR